MMLFRSRDGYAFLVTVLVIGIMATATAVSLMLLGWAAEQNGLLVQRAGQAEQYAKGCVERVFRILRLDPSFAGGETITFARGSCTIRSVAGDGVNDRRVCVEGVSGTATKRFQLRAHQLFPSMKITSFEEVPDFTLCP